MIDLADYRLMFRDMRISNYNRSPRDPFNMLLFFLSYGCFLFYSQPKIATRTPHFSLDTPVKFIGYAFTYAAAAVVVVDDGNVLFFVICT